MLHQRAGNLRATAHLQQSFTESAGSCRVAGLLGPDVPGDLHPQVAVTADRCLALNGGVCCDATALRLIRLRTDLR